MRDLVAAEILKLRTTRTVQWLLAGTVLFAAVAVSGAVLTADSRGVDLASPLGIRTALHVAGAGGAFVVVLGIVTTAGEFRRGTATETFLTTPQRGRVIAAKLITMAGVGFAFGLVAASVAFGLWRMLLQREGIAVPLSDQNIWLTLLGAVISPALNAAIGVGVGAVVRNQVAAIVGALAWLFVGESLLISVASGVARWLPGAAGQGLIRAPQDGLLPMAGAGALLLAYALAASAAGAWLTAHRDA